MKKLHDTIQRWYRKHGRRELPWRNTDDPYHIYLSEVMLQQTQVKTVLEKYYFPFIEAFPTLHALAEAPLDDLLKAWEGLGYYNRARNLHRTAALISELPREIDALITLPGIGKNTAHAIAAFAFKQPVPVMEANVKRILCRLHRLAEPAEKTLWKHAYAMVDRNNPFEYNQAMMDIGAMICLPKNPKCEVCPLSSLCQGKEDAERYPLRKKRAVPVRESHIVVNIYEEKLSLSKREGKFLHGLWGFESVLTPPCGAEYIGEISHTYTHFKLLGRVYLYYENAPDHAPYFGLEQINELAISKADEKVKHLISNYI